MFSETLEELLDVLNGYEYELFWAHGKSLPDCFNEPTERALADPDVFAVLYCEDDMIIPKDILEDMFAQNYPVVALDYPFKQDGDSTCFHDPNGYAFYTGTGFLLVAREILEQLEKPIWRTDVIFDPFVDTDTIHWWPRKLDKIYYGLHDLYFGMILYSNGIPVLPMSKTAGQRKLVALGKPHVNRGAHVIKKLTKVGRNMVIRDIDERTKDLWLGAMGRIKKVRFWEDTPPFIGYDENQQPYLKGDKAHESVEYV